MKKYVFLVEKTDTGYSAYAKDDEIHTGSTGSTIAELKDNVLKAINLLFEHQAKNTVTAENITLQLDLPQFFEYYNEINAAGFSKRIGINYTLLHQYVKGAKEPSAKQVSKIAKGLRELGKELMEFDYT